METASVLATTIVAIALFLALCTALALVTLSMHAPSAPMLIAAGAVVVSSLVVIAVLPWNVPVLFGAVLALLGVALATVGGNPFTRWILGLADGGRVAEGSRGGILVELMAEGDEVEILRGGTTIGYLERLGAALGIIAGFPAIIAVIVALKGVGRFTELSTPAARERFIVGTMASLLWACTVSALVWLAIW